MTLHIFDAGLNYRGRLDHYQSLRWSEEYQNKGGFSLVVDNTAANAALLTHGCIIYRSDRKTAMIAVSVNRSEKNKIITVGGYTTMHLLDRRVVKGLYTVTNAESGIYGMVSGNLRGLPVSISESHGFQEEHPDEFEDEKLLDALYTIATGAGLGIRMNFDARTKAHTLEVYKGVNRAYTPEGGGLVFSSEFGNLSDLSVVEDDDIYKNVAIVRSDDLNGNAVYVEVGEADDAERRETILTASGQKSDETSSDFYERLKNAGRDLLQEYYNVLTFKATISAAALGTKYDLGDRVTCNSTRYGVRFDTIISAFTETIEGGVRSITVTLGNPEITYIRGAIIKNG